MLLRLPGIPKRITQKWRASAYLPDFGIAAEAPPATAVDDLPTGQHILHIITSRSRL